MFYVFNHIEYKTDNYKWFRKKYQNHHILIKKMLLILFSVSVMVLLIRDEVILHHRVHRITHFFVKTPCSRNCFSSDYSAFFSMVNFQLKKVITWWFSFLRVKSRFLFLGGFFCFFVFWVFFLFFIFFFLHHSFITKIRRSLIQATNKSSAGFNVFLVSRLQF